MASAAVHIDSDRDRLDRAMIHRFLSEQSYWAAGISRDLVDRSIDHALCFGAYVEAQQVGFARVVTDYATFGYLADVFVLPAFRGGGIARRLIAAAMAHPDVANLRRIMLATRDAHALYTSFGFQSVTDARPLMQIHRPEIYRKGRSGESIS
ncbi:GNAT family N-acetyltransferase [Pseudomarimonas arenosa]|uniref:GNAT family N-acetyltransferase n=1 Tax=Pseudomarimonas arenosa TaxID=2774145 RepID=A0AAW3ZJQ3_9GAMM|nr:GNAT family N-acetyltransferase [Pseudomarimonas arenosa]MBD8525402.1 GNAT family N-acetyltransferase [Pseudomarimonas arenosa]